MLMKQAIRDHFYAYIGIKKSCAFGAPPGMKTRYTRDEKIGVKGRLNFNAQKLA